MYEGSIFQQRKPPRKVKQHKAFISGKIDGVELITYDTY